MDTNNTILGKSPGMTFCYPGKPLDWSSYYLVPDVPRIAPPLDHRPTWKGASNVPNQAPSSLVVDSSIDRVSTKEGSGFLPHKGEFVHYTKSVDNESSLRNLDQPLTKRAYGQRILTSQTQPSSHPNIQLLPSYRAKGKSLYSAQDPGAPCGVYKKYDQEPLNQAMFNNSTRLTTKNLNLQHTRQSSNFTLLKPRYIGSVSNN